MAGWIDAWMDGVVLIRCIDRWMVFFCTLAVPVRCGATFVLQALFGYPPELSFSQFWLLPGPPADPKIRSKTPRIDLGRLSFSHMRFLAEI